jgi:hypothetical protein
MSVLVVLKIPVDADGLRKAAGEHGDLMREISGRGREQGAIHHDFYAGNDGSVIVVDEWDSAESFQGFFESEGQNIGQLMQAAGATGAPDAPRFYEKLSLGDEF